MAKKIKSRNLPHSEKRRNNTTSLYFNSLFAFLKNTFLGNFEWLPMKEPISIIADISPVFARILESIKIYKTSFTRGDK
ncbi:hypothetical protein [Rickettsiales endosymbiont of Stachyamoeba lipophora]|uniref:hypothetical protein n=1 Tax=Rickettsiales endosymbiont of Stachyamoeba lipophora TaxID=2486578 RepID=UPI000F64F52F|nr:hypothetical protein [Rickettsiales endosymbiont of Stachyamoeba lipophora]AZL16360.1 hypothetical protein EF513_07465 [Rickettsiales endosymbiont of Stachyamoeba lipophora]